MYVELRTVHLVNTKISFHFAFEDIQTTIRNVGNLFPRLCTFSWSTVKNQYRVVRSLLQPSRRVLNLHYENRYLLRCRTRKKKPRVFKKLNKKQSSNSVLNNRKSFAVKIIRNSGYVIKLNAF